MGATGEGEIKMQRRMFTVLICLVALATFIATFLGCGSQGKEENLTAPLGRSSNGAPLYYDKAGSLTVGQLHNQISTEMDSKHSFDGPKYVKPEDFLTDFTDAINTVFEGNGYYQRTTEAEVVKYLAMCDSLAAEEIFIASDEPVVLDPSTFVSGMVNRGLMSSTDGAWLLGLLNEILALTDADDVPATVVQYGALHGLPVPGTVLAVGVDILLNSHVWWTDPAKIDGNTIGHDLFDLIGGIAGGVISGGNWVGILIGGAAGSIYYECISTDV